MHRQKKKFRSHVFPKIKHASVKGYKMRLNDTAAARKLFKKLNPDPIVVGVAKHVAGPDPVLLPNQGGDTDIVIRKLGGRPDYNVEYGGGRTIDGAQLHVVFWGPEWLADVPPSNPSAQEILSDISIILASPYLYGCIQYGAGFHQSTLKDAWIDDRDFPSFFTLVDANYEAWLMMTSGPIEPSGSTIICIIMPPGADPAVNLNGQHGYSVQPDLQRIPVMWVKYRNREGMSSTFSHELVETVTDPFWDGYKISNTDFDENEIADVCAITGVLNNVTVQSYYSADDKNCIIPLPLPVEAWQIQVIEKPWGTHDNPNEHITGVGGIRLPSNEKFWMKQTDVLFRLAKGDKFIVIGADASEALVKSYIHFPPWFPKGYHYIATVPDDSKEDNLLALPDSTERQWLLG